MIQALEKPQALSDSYTHYGPGCTHGIIHRLIAEVIDELGIKDKLVGIALVGRAVPCTNISILIFRKPPKNALPPWPPGSSEYGRT